MVGQIGRIKMGFSKVRNVHYRRHPTASLKCVIFYQKAEFKSLKIWCSYIFYAVQILFNILKYQRISLSKGLAWFSLI